jgi:hypothetical protein
MTLTNVGVRSTKNQRKVQRIHKTGRDFLVTLKWGNNAVLVWLDRLIGRNLGSIYEMNNWAYRSLLEKWQHEERQSASQDRWATRADVRFEWRGFCACLRWRSRDTQICTPGATLTPENNPYTGLPGLSTHPPVPSSSSYSIFSQPSCPPVALFPFFTTCIHPVAVPTAVA